jgi:ubiquitin carboxyl-terminal hydrolase 7
MSPKLAMHDYLDMNHRFTLDSPDWGFQCFEGYENLYYPTQGRSKSIIENGSTIVHAFVRVVRDTTGVLWYDFEKLVLSNLTAMLFSSHQAHKRIIYVGRYNSKETTGYVGLENQGVTRYLNASLHALYFTPCLRKVGSYYLLLYMCAMFETILYLLNIHA